MARIVGNNDGPNGRNATYTVGKRRSVLRLALVEEVKAGRHPGYHVVSVGGLEYVRKSRAEKNR